jgi:glycosyltransferase involved in cell wall biosynthesis
MLSVIIITKNEAASIDACLKSILWADEIIVVDSASHDDTVSICKKYGAKVFQNDWRGFGKQKNYALSKVTGDWVLSVDADERVTPLLEKEIKTSIASSNTIIAWEFPRLSSLCGKYIHHCGWRPDRVTRLFKNGNAIFSDDIVHEKLIVNGKVGRLKNHLLHESIESIDDLLAKMNQYTSAGALMLKEQNQNTSLTKAVLKAFWAFLRCYVLRAGFLDGREGFIISVSMAESSYYRQVKLLMLQNK